MKIIQCIIPVSITIFWCYFLNYPIYLKDQTIPSIGNFFSPFIGFWQNGNEPLDTKVKSIPNTQYEGQVYFDERAVPHIISNSIESAYFIQGYIHAMHRLWQMDFSTRASEGRISEIIGSKALEFDKNKRRKGLAESARRSIEIWKKNTETFTLLEAYSNGINYYINQLDYKSLPIEYKLMNYRPELWSPYKSALYHKAMAEILCGRDQDIEMSNAKQFFGNDFDLLYPEYNKLTDPVIPAGTKWNFQIPKNDSASIITNPKIITIPIDSSPSGLGSNNWAISAIKSSSGNPILCNDPHLSLNLPSIWYEQQIITPELNVYGVSFAGIPGVIIGFNKDIAWGITNAGWDVVDWYKIDWKDDYKTSYIVDGNVENIKFRIEEIKIKNQKSVFDTIKITRWGPIVYEDPQNPKFDLAMHWIIQDEFNLNELLTFVKLNKSKNYKEYREALNNFSYPAQNFAFASGNGDIAITVQGAMPIKSNQQGRFIQSGAEIKNEWKGFLNFSLNPHCLNPERGFISSANQRSTTLDYPNYYNNGDFRDYRGTLINRLISQKNLWTVDDLKNLQFNNYSLIAETALPLFINNLDTNSLTFDEKAFVGKLESWNKNYDSSSIEATQFDIWFQEFYKLVWDEITQDTLRKYTSLPSEQTTINVMNSDPGIKYFDLIHTEKIENLGDILELSLDSATTKFKKINSKTWGEYKATHIDHIARIPAFGIPFISTSGSKDIINASWKTWGPSWRMVVELTKEGPVAWGVYPGGQDGRPGNKHYMDMINKWQKGEYYDLKYANNESDLNTNCPYKLQFIHK